MSKFIRFKPEETDVLVRGLKLLKAETRVGVMDAKRMNAPPDCVPRLEARLKMIIMLLDEAAKPGRETRNSYWMGHAHGQENKPPFHHRKNNRPYDSAKEAGLYRQGYSAGLKEKP